MFADSWWRLQHSEILSWPFDECRYLHYSFPGIIFSYYEHHLSFIVFLLGTVDQGTRYICLRGLSFNVVMIVLHVVKIVFCGMAFAVFTLPVTTVFWNFLLQRFTNEDHLAVHKHKHEMTLKFGPARNDSVIVAGKYILLLSLFTFLLEWAYVLCIFSTWCID